MGIINRFTTENYVSEKIENIVDTNGKLLNSVLPNEYPYEKITVNSRLDFSATIVPYNDGNLMDFNGPIYSANDENDVFIPVYAGNGVTYSRGRWTLPTGYSWYFTVNGVEINIPNFNELTYNKTTTLSDTFNECEITVKPVQTTILVNGEQKNFSILLFVTIKGYGASNPLPDIQLEYRNVKIKTLDPKFLPEGLATETYVTEQTATLKNELLNGAGPAYDTLQELGELIDENTDALEALNTVATNKQDRITDTLILTDAVTGSQYKIQIQNGQLVSFPIE